MYEELGGGCGITHVTIKEAANLYGAFLYTVLGLRMQFERVCIKVRQQQKLLVYNTRDTLYTTQTV